MKKKRKMKQLSILLIAALFIQMFVTAIPKASAEERVFTVVGDFQSEAGAANDWDPTSAVTDMTAVGNNFYQYKVTLPVGTYQYKIAVNHSWNENYGYGGQNGGNFTIQLDKEQEVIFYYHDGTHAAADSTWYAAIPQKKQPRIAGTIQSAINAGNEWSPSTSTAFLYDDNFDSTYSFTANVPKGNYEYKIVLGSDWGEEYPGQNASLKVLEDTQITFYFNNATKEVSTDYQPIGSDGTVQKEALYHNTWDKAFRSPFGAIAAGTPVTLRLQTNKDDLTNASVLVKNFTTGNSKTYTMNKAGWQNGKDYWEVQFKPDTKGVYGYKFKATDGSAVVEYGEDVQEGKTGTAVDNNAGMFQLTVYDPTYETPDWMKEAVIYQIFPDRFYNGNLNNDTAKQNARGSEPIEHMDWSELPDNPDLANRSDYSGDKIWSNDFFGGDITGVQAKLDYVQSLGVNTIYLNPIAKAASNHKYDATDWKTIDPMFGTPEEFTAFTKELESRGMHLILDGVFNHVGDDSIYFDRYGKYKTVGAYEYWAKIYDLMNDDGLNEEDAKVKARELLVADGQVFNEEYGFHNWFNIKNVKVGKEGSEHYDYQAWWGFDSLPEIKSVPGDAVDYNSELNNKQFADYIMYDDDSVSKTWIENGGSGWRLDVANEVDPEFWREFRQQLKSDTFAGTGATLQEGEKPLILGEIWDDASQYFLGDQYDSVMNYRFQKAVIELLKNGNAQAAADQLKAVQEDYPREAYYALMNLMGTHDTARAVFVLGNGTDTNERAEFDQNYNYELGVKRLKLASIIQMGFPGAPTIYYGDEAGVTGSKDPDNRRTYLWDNQNTSLIEHYQTVGKVRETNQTLFSSGEMKFLYAEGDVFAFARYTDDKVAVVAVNRGNSEQTVEIDVHGLLKNGIKLTDQLVGNYEVEAGSGKISIAIPAMSGRMLVSNDGQNLAFPTSVSNIEGIASEGQVELTWAASKDAVKYNVYQTNLKGAFYEKVAITDKNSVIVDGLTNGRNYYFAVTAVDEKGNESKLQETNDPVVPHFEWKDGKHWIGGVTSLSDQVLDLANVHELKAEVWIEGATESGHAEGLVGKLKLKGPNDSEWSTIDAAYVGQSGNNNQFGAKFRAIEAGTYSYKFAFTTDNGETWKETDTIDVTLSQNENDKEAPAEGVELAQPLQESGQVNLSWQVTNLKTDDAYLIGIERDDKLLQLITDTNATAYKDSDVENGTTYNYQVKIYDRSGNVVSSNKVDVTPDIVMVKVTFKVAAPAYTPLDAKLTIPNSVNGWNTGAWEMTRNGAVTPNWQFTTEVQAGTQITYKYVKNNTWDQEGLADHTRYDQTDDDISFYGFGTTGTDLTVTVENQGNNEMVIEDTILRWIDMPVVLTTPTNGATVESEYLPVKGTAIKGSKLTINDEQVEVKDDMSFEHQVKLNYGKNTIKVKIEPTEWSKANIFKNDSGAISKNTKEYTLEVYSTFGEVAADGSAIQLSKNKGNQGYKVTLDNEVLKDQLAAIDVLKAYVFNVDMEEMKHLTFGIHQQIVQQMVDINPEAILQIRVGGEKYNFPVKDFKLGSRKDKTILEVTQGNVSVQLKGNIGK